MFFARMNLKYVAMKNSIKVRLVILSISAIFLVIAVDYIPHIIAWMPLLVSAYYSAKNKDFRDWFSKLSEEICRTE